jgi:hypothetical protein
LPFFFKKIFCRPDVRIKLHKRWSTKIKNKVNNKAVRELSKRADVQMKSAYENI